MRVSKEYCDICGKEISPYNNNSVYLPQDFVHESEPILKGCTIVDYYDYWRYECREFELCNKCRKEITKVSNDFCKSTKKMIKERKKMEQENKEKLELEKKQGFAAFILGAIFIGIFALAFVLSCFGIISI